MPFVHSVWSSWICRVVAALCIFAGATASLHAQEQPQKQQPQQKTDEPKRDVIVTPPAQPGKTTAPAAAPPPRWIGTLATAAPLADGQQTTGEHLWVAQLLSNGKFSLLHRQITRQPEDLHRAFTASGKPAAMAAYFNNLYIFYEDRTVQRVRAQPRQDPQINPYPTTQLPPLPADAELLAVTASRSGPVALVRSTAPPEGEAAKTAPAGDGPRIRLLRQSATAWVDLKLPPDLSPHRVRSVVTIDGPADRLAVISVIEGGASSVRVDEVRGEQWSTWTYQQATHSRTQFVGVADLYMVRPQTLDPLRLEVLWLRRGASREVGSFPGITSVDDWWALSGDDRILLLIRRGEELAVSWYGVLESTEPPPPIPLKVTDSPAPITEPMLMMMSVVMILIVVLILSARRDPQSTLPRLPPRARVAGSSRVIAALIDFAPALAIAMYLYKVRQPGELLVYWPTFTLEWDKTLPAVTAVGIFVAHTFLLELILGASLGKLITGIRVADVTGGRAGFMQVLLRNLAKAIELAVPLLLIVPLMNPHHQRLGDLIGRTVVIHRRQAPGEPKKPADSDDDSESGGPPPPANPPRSD